MGENSSTTAAAPFLSPETADALNKALQIIVEPAVNPSALANSDYFARRMEAIRTGKPKGLRELFKLGDIGQLKIFLAFDILVQQFGYTRATQVTPGVTAHFEKDGRGITIYDTRPADGDRRALPDWRAALDQTGPLVEAFQRDVMVFRRQYARLLHGIADFLETDRIPPEAQ